MALRVAMVAVIVLAAWLAGITLATTDAPAEAAVLPCSGALALGATCSGTIVVSGAEDQFLINANAGDRILLRVSRASGSIVPQVRMPIDAGTVCNNGGVVGEVLCAPLVSTGFHDVFVQDLADTATGSYRLFVQRTNNPGGAEVLSAGTSQSDPIDPGGAKTYTFSGNGGAIYLRARSTSAGFVTQMRVYKPDGQLLCDVNGTGGYIEGVCYPTTTSTHTLLINDYQGTDSGTVETYMQKLGSPSSATPLPIGQSGTGSAAFVGMGTHTFSIVGVNETVIVRAVTTAGMMQPTVRIFSAGGTLHCQVTAASLAEEVCVLEESGSYTMLVGDDLGDGTGDYAVYVQNLTDPLGLYFPNNGEVWLAPGAAARLSAIARTYSSGDRIMLRASRTGGNSQPEIRVFTPAGSLVCSGNSTTSATIFCDIPSNGTYVTLFGDLTGAGVSDYGLHVRQLSSSFGAMLTLRGSTRTGSILRIGESALFEFAGVSGQQYTATLTNTNGQLQPVVRLLRPNGTEACAGGAVPVATATCTLDVTGTWRVLVEDEDADQVGAYSLALTCSNCPALAADHDGDGVANAADVCPATADPAQTNTDAAPLDIPGATFDDVTRPNGDNIGDACDADDDNDGLIDGVESGCGVYPVPMNSSNALSADSDGDRSQDLYECMVGTNPGSAASKPNLAALGGADNDQLPDAMDRFFGSFPNGVDSDQDGISDGVEVRGYFTSPYAQKTDRDACLDDTEIASVNEDTVVSAIDLNQVAQRFFVTTAPVFDLNKDGTVSALDLSLQAQNFQLSPC